MARSYPPVVGWRVYVEGNQVFDSRTHIWNDVPGDGIIEMVLYKEDGYRETLGGHDNYFIAPHLDGTIYASSSDAVESIESRYSGAVVKRGKWVPTQTMARVSKEALDYQWWADDPFNRNLKAV